MADGGRESSSSDQWDAATSVDVSRYVTKIRVISEKGNVKTKEIK